jgi:hypothetical protein
MFWLGGLWRITLPALCGCDMNYLFLYKTDRRGEDTKRLRDEIGS